MKNVGLLVGTLLLTLIVVVVVAVVFTKKTAPTPIVENPNAALYLADERNYKGGSATGSATLVEFSDFQCPACKASQYLIDQMVEKYGDKLKIVYRHFPLRQIHPNAAIAARAAEAAANQGAFFAYHDVLFDQQEAWASDKDPRTKFVEYATTLGLNTTTFQKDLNDASLDTRISKDESDGLALSVNATPTFFLNGKRVEIGDLQAALEAAINGK